MSNIQKPKLFHQVEIDGVTFKATANPYSENKGARSIITLEARIPEGDLEGVSKALQNIAVMERIFKNDKCYEVERHPTRIYILYIKIDPPSFLQTHLPFLPFIKEYVPASPEKIEQEFKGIQIVMNNLAGISSPVPDAVTQKDLLPPGADERQTSFTDSVKRESQGREKEVWKRTALMFSESKLEPRYNARENLARKLTHYLVTKGRERISDADDPAMKILASEPDAYGKYEGVELSTKEIPEYKRLLPTIRSFLAEKGDDFDKVEKFTTLFLREVGRSK